MATHKPVFHLAPDSGWLNDPNGPLYYEGEYHLFYQHVPSSSEWNWGLVWGHAVSQDLATWRHLPHAIAPTPGTLDRDGCFSGCAAIDTDGTPTLLYTGVVRKPADQIRQDTSPQYEYQLAARAVPGDPQLIRWEKQAAPLLDAPPEGMTVTGWRDPFIIEHPSVANGGRWVMMVGGGLAGEAGTAMVYSSQQLTAGWRYEGLLAKDPSCTMWECPLLAPLPLHAGNAAGNGAAAGRINGANGSRSAPASSGKHMLVVCQDYCANIPAVWIGDYHGVGSQGGKPGTFDMASAAGPFKLDLGDVVYAPNLITDQQGRVVYWAWLQERARPAGQHDYACCMTIPRVVTLKDGHLFQEPLPELKQLRVPGGPGGAGAWRAPAQQLRPGTALPITGLGSTCHADVELQLARGESDAVALIMHPFRDAATGEPLGSGAAVLVSWDGGSLHVAHTTSEAAVARAARRLKQQASSAPAQALPLAGEPAEPPQHPSTMGDAGEHREEQHSHPPLVGGHLAALQGCAGGGPGAQRPVALRVLLDGSSVEVFTSSGEVLATRVYRGCTLPESARVGVPRIESTGGEIELVAIGGPAALLDGEAWAMQPMWQGSQLQPAAAERPAVPEKATLPEPIPVYAAAGLTATVAAACGAEARAPVLVNAVMAPPMQMVLGAAGAEALEQALASPLMSPRSVQAQA